MYYPQRWESGTVCRRLWSSIFLMRDRQGVEHKRDANQLRAKHFDLVESPPTTTPKSVSVFVVPLSTSRVVASSSGLLNRSPKVEEVESGSNVEEAGPAPSLSVASVTLNTSSRVTEVEIYAPEVCERRNHKQNP